MRTRVFTLAIYIAALLMSATVACAAPLFYEGFGYAAGSTVGPDGSWTTNSGGGLNVVAPGGTYADGGGNVMETSGNSTFVPMNNQWISIGKALPQSVSDLFAQNGTIYASFLIKEYASLGFVASPNTANQVLINVYSGIRSATHYNLGAETQLNIWPDNTNREGSTGGEFYWNGVDWALWGIRIVMQDGPDEITVLRNLPLTGSVDWDTGFTTINPGPNQYGRRADGIKLLGQDVTASGFSELRVGSAGGVMAWEGAYYQGGVDEIRIASTWAGAIESGIGSIIGVVDLQGYDGDISDVGLTVELRRSGWPATTEKVFPNSLGNFSVDNVVPDTYDIAIKAPSWLQEVLVDQVVSGETDVGTITLRNGDADGSSEVNSTDLSVVLKNINVDGDL